MKTYCIWSGLLLASIVILGGCMARDVYPKYLKMKEEAKWVERQCDITNEGLQTVYKGSLASVRLECKKPMNKAEWQAKLKSGLSERGYQHIRDAYPPIEIFCLANTGIKLHFSEDDEFHFGLFYPDKECPIE